MSQHDEDMFADVIKGAMERGIDVPKLIADVLRKRSRESPPAADAVDPIVADPGTMTTREKKRPTHG